MPMPRQFAIALAAVVALVCAIAPLVMAFHLAWMRSVNREQAALDSLARRARLHAEALLTEATDTLGYFQMLPVAPCSTEHIRQMRTGTMSTRAIKQIGYFERDILKCTSWGRWDTPMRLPAADWVMRNGAELRLNTYPLNSPDLRMVDIYFRGHNALIDPSRLTDLDFAPSVRLAVVTPRGGLVESDHGADPRLTAALIARGDADDPDHLFAVSRGDDLTVIAYTPRSEALADARRELWLLLPAGVVTAAGLLALVALVLRWRLSMKRELAFAIDHGELIVHYQPIIALATGACIGAEALVRWRRRDGAMVRPDLFIPLAEEQGLMPRITARVMDIVIHEMGEALIADPGLHIAINLSAQDMRPGGALDTLPARLAGTGIPAARIWLEATERGFVDFAAATPVLAAARARGHKIAIDDFGTGFSSLAALQTLPLDTLKIDKAFVDTIGTDSATSSVTLHIIEMAKSLHLDIVAEGVESPAQAAYLKAHGVGFGQGWLYAKAMPAAAFLQYHRQGCGAQTPEEAPRPA